MIANFYLIDHLWKNEERAHLTAQELFIYSLALLYGIEVETEYNTSMLLQMSWWLCIRWPNSMEMSSNTSAKYNILANFISYVIVFLFICFYSICILLLP